MMNNSDDSPREKNINGSCRSSQRESKQKLFVYFYNTVFTDTQIKRIFREFKSLQCDY